VTPVLHNQQEHYFACAWYATQQFSLIVNSKVKNIGEMAGFLATLYVHCLVRDGKF